MYDVLFRKIKTIQMEPKRQVNILIPAQFSAEFDQLCAKNLWSRTEGILMGMKKLMDEDEEEIPA